MNKVKNNQSCITCRYSEESYEDILGAGGQPETILVRRCPFVNDEIVNDDFLCGKFKMWDWELSKDNKPLNRINPLI